MTVSQQPAPARSDLPLDRTAPGTPSPDAAARHPFRRQGLLLTAGAVVWATGMVLFGLDPATRAGEMGYSLTSGIFQLGLLGLVQVLWRTDALGTGRVAKAALGVQVGLVTLAIGSTVADGIGVSDLTQPGWALLDAFWPFSMLGMFLIGVRIAVAGRWRGVRRIWPLLAESWAVVTIPTLMVFGPLAAQIVAPLHLLAGYAVLGVLVATKPGEPVR